MAKVLVAWIGTTDLRVSEGEAELGQGPIAQALTRRTFASIELLADFEKSRVQKFKHWLSDQFGVPIRIHHCRLSSPTDFGEIHQAVTDVLEGLGSKTGELPDLTFHLSPGTPAMAAVWILLSKTRYPAELIESSRERGVVTAAVPFDISAEFLPDLLRKPDKRLEALSEGLPPAAPAFEAIIHRGPEMKRIIAMARRVAPRSVPILLEGESGTGKELLARAIHNASPRASGPFVAVNCGAIPKDLFEAEFFGHEKGAFTGAAQARAGYFEAAHDGTLFLDELGELPLPAQVKLLRVLQEGEVQRLGSSKPRRVTVRIVAATNRNLAEAIQTGEFREDLYFRLAVAIIQLPALRDRQGDLGMLMDAVLAQVNEESREDPGYQHKKISAGAKSVMLRHRWPGNVRELLNTVRRAAIWSSGATITEADMKDAIALNLPILAPGDSVLGRSVSEGIDLPELLEEVRRHYLEAAMRETGGNKTKAAKLVGLANYQTFTNWMRLCGMK